MRKSMISKLPLCAGLFALMSGGSCLAGYNSVYAFGDGVCTTTNGPGGSLYHGGRYCNGRVWIEVLCQWQGTGYQDSKNLSAYGNDSAIMLGQVNAMATPPDAANSLFIIWSANADFVNLVTEEIDAPYSSLTPWNNMIAQSISNHTAAVNTLYSKGARRILMPNAVDALKIPYFNFFASADKAFARARIIDFNNQFRTAMRNLEASKSGLVIYLPDAFTFLDQVLANPGTYGLVNPFPSNAGAYDAPSPSVNGNGSNYVFWDDFHPTAKFQMHLAAFIQQIISPVKVNSLTLSGGNVHMQVANIPLNRDGSILGSANLQPPWVQDVAIDENLNTTKTYVFPVSGSRRFYRVAFPVVWTWP